MLQQFAHVLKFADLHIADNPYFVSKNADLIASVSAAMQYIMLL